VGTARLDAERREAPVGARADRGRAAVAALAAVRLPVPSALPLPPCPTERPPLAVPTQAPDAHADACHLSWEAKQREGGKRSIARLGDAA
jgi:hypothetical protein